MEQDGDGSSPRRTGQLSELAKGATVNFRSGATDSMPERKQVTQQIELRKKQQIEADRKSQSETIQSAKIGKQ
jgi:phosphoglycerate-specific signal transduction histidine kinase